MNTMSGYGWLAVCVLLTACATIQVMPVEQREGLTFGQLAPGVWLHTSYRDMPGIGRIRSNGLVVTDGQTATLIDTAWTDAQTAAVLDWIEAELGVPVTQAVFTHAHADKMGGVGVVRQRGIATFAHRLSNDVAFSRDLVPAEFDLVFDPGGRSTRLDHIEIFYPGPGHTADNLVVWHRRSKSLFGGCLIRPATAKTLGNTADADVPQWAASVRRVAGRFGNARIVVPSHGDPGGTGLFEHTVALANRASGEYGAGGR